MLEKNLTIMEFSERFFNRTNSSGSVFDPELRNLSKQNSSMARPRNSSEVSAFIIVPYGLIFLLSVLGNALVILTLVRHKKMRTVTNMFLLNLAISDLLLAVFCIPFTLVSMLMQKFIFGPVVCVLLRFAQAVSVGVSCGTLVAISIERFYAICQPLRSRQWQTLKHSYKVIFTIWLTSAFLMLPIAVFNKNIELPTGTHACREIWPDKTLESLYAILLDVVLLVLPLLLMAYSYCRISRALWSEVSIPTTPESGSPHSEPGIRTYARASENGCTGPNSQSPLIQQNRLVRSISSESSSGRTPMQVHHPAHNSRVIANKKRVVKMLCVIVLEYFICWTPQCVLNSWSVLDYPSVHENFTILSKSAILLLFYLSSCVHPITYCFMNKRFRQYFADVFRCCFRRRLSSTFYSVAFHVNGGSESVNGRSNSRQCTIMWRNQS